MSTTYGPYGTVRGGSPVYETRVLNAIRATQLQQAEGAARQQPARIRHKAVVPAWLKRISRNYNIYIYIYT